MMWGREDDGDGDAHGDLEERNRSSPDSLVAGTSSGFSDCTTLDAMPSSTSSNGFASRGGSSSYMNSSDEKEMTDSEDEFATELDDSVEFADVLEWTHEQVDALTELCLAFEGIPRGRVIDALVASAHDPSAAALVLLDPSSSSSEQRPQQQQVEPEGRYHLKQPLEYQNQQRWGGEAGWNGKRRATSAATMRRREKARLRALQRPGLTGVAALRGASCGGERAGFHIRDGGTGDVEGGGGVGQLDGDRGQEEEEGDEGLSSVEYRARADEAAEEMKAWFHKAAEAFTQGGR